MTQVFAEIQKGNKHFDLVCDKDLTIPQVDQIVPFVSNWLGAVGDLFDGPRHTIRVWISDAGFSTSIDVDAVEPWA